MSGFFDQDFGGPIPWMAAIDVKTPVLFEIDIRSIETIESKVPFGSGVVTEGIADMSDIETAEGDMIAEDGEHRIPFWACKPLQEVLAEHQKKKRATLVFTRDETVRNGKVNSVAIIHEKD